MVLEDWVAFPVGNRYGLFTAGFIEGSVSKSSGSQKGIISGMENILVVFDAGENRTPGVYENPEKTKSFPMFVSWIDGKLTSSLKTTSLLLLFISHFHADHINLIPAVIKEWVQRVKTQNSKMLIVFPSGNFIEGSLWVARERVARANYVRVLIDAIASMREGEESSFDEENASNLLDVIRFIYGDNSVLRKWDVHFNENNIYRIIVPSIPEKGFDYEGFYDLIIPETPNNGFPSSGWFRWNRRGNEGRERNRYEEGDFLSEIGGFSVSCDYCVSIDELDLSNWFIHWNIGVSDVAVKNTYVLLHKYEGNSPIPGIGVYANHPKKPDLVHVFMPYFADRMKTASMNAFWHLERQYWCFLKKGASIDSVWCLQKMIQTQYKCVFGANLNESSMVLFHSPSNTVKTNFPWWYLDWCCCEWCCDDCLLSGSRTLHLPFLSDARWYLMTGDQYMDRIIDMFENRWRKERRSKLYGHFNNENFAWIQVPHHGSWKSWSRNNTNKNWYSLPDGIHRKYFISGTTGSNVISTIDDLINNKKCVFWLR